MRPRAGGWGSWAREFWPDLGVALAGAGFFVVLTILVFDSSPREWVVFVALGWPLISLCWITIRVAGPAGRLCALGWREQLALTEIQAGTYLKQTFLRHTLGVSMPFPAVFIASTFFWAVAVFEDSGSEAWQWLSVISLYKIISHALLYAGLAGLPARLCRVGRDSSDVGWWGLALWVAVAFGATEGLFILLLLSEGLGLINNEETFLLLATGWGLFVLVGSVWRGIRMWKRSIEGYFQFERPECGF